MARPATRWPDLYSADWQPDDYNSLPLQRETYFHPDLADMNAEFERKGLDVEAVAVDGTSTCAARTLRTSRRLGTL
jgi:hypothetical protein